ncbi:uncharacterized protein LOC129765956 [Toxorhynchites rutilus septentrionalis]|uniref:uncharacterized protein LOC129765956 n=1 Tax=Toxorhynchites rutilus septentrionalis TaxID=329112 RepID=UPI0024795FD9|nr:uncharacterized protein LOC129765956 [Toxorhynchites rutilus septentrionalis]
MAENKQKITNKKQFELMVGILEKNPTVAKGLKFAECSGIGRGHFNNVWSDITATLNSAGPPIRKTQEWQKVWSDLKQKIKKKLQHNQTEARATGGGPNRIVILSSYEETVANLLSFQKTIDHEGPSFGLNLSVSPEPQSSNACEMSLDGENDENLEVARGESIDVPIAITPVISSRPSSRNYRHKLLEQQSDYLRVLVENSRESHQLQKEALELQKEKFIFKKENFARAEKYKADELQFHLQVLEYKKMKLELQRSQVNENRK